MNDPFENDKPPKKKNSNELNLFKNFSFMNPQNDQKNQKINKVMHIDSSDNIFMVGGNQDYENSDHDQSDSKNKINKIFNEDAG